MSNYSRSYAAPVLREEFYVCGAAGYPDPWRCDTFEEARRFALAHEFNRVLDRKVEVTINRRVVSNHEIVWMNGPASFAELGPLEMEDDGGFGNDFRA